MFKWLEYIIRLSPIWSTKLPKKNRSFICNIVGYIYTIFSILTIIIVLIVGLLSLKTLNNIMR